MKNQESETMQGVFLPGGAPKELVDFLNAEIAKVMAMQDVKEKCAQLGFDVVADKPDRFAAYIKGEVEKWAQVIRDAKIAQIRKLCPSNMRIVDIRETAIPLKSTLANSSFNFSEMTTSVVAVITDVVRDGKPVVGYAFNSTGRYACGAQMRARADSARAQGRPGTRCSTRPAATSIRPRSWPAMMQREKPGGHTERSVRRRHDRSGVWDAVAKIEDRPLHAVLAERFSGGVHAGGGALLCRRRLVHAGQGRRGTAGRDPLAPRRGLPTMKIKVGGAPLAEDLVRLEASIKTMGGAGTPGGGRQRRLRSHARHRLRQGAGAVRAALVRGADRSARLRAARRTRRDLSAAAGHRREPVLDAGRARTWCASAACAPTATSSRSTFRSPTASCSSRAPLRMLEAHGWKRSAMYPHGGNQMTLGDRRPASASAAARPTRACSACSPASPTTRRSSTACMKLSDRPGIGFEAQNGLYALMKELAA